MKIIELSSYPGLKKLTGVDIFVALGNKYIEFLRRQIEERLSVERRREIILFWIHHRN
jgi:hypothetical protein